MRIRPFFVAGVLMFAGLSGEAFSAMSGGGRFYCCTDANGKYVCGDILPYACYGRAYRELGADGRTLREVAAPLTAEQRAQRAAEEVQRQKDAILQKEQQRKDQVLLETYIDLDDIEAARKRALDNIHQSIRNAEERIADIQVHRRKYEEEAEFYQKKELPPEIRKGLADTEFEIKAQESIIEKKSKDLTALREKFDEDRRRFLDLQQRKVPRTP
ncbi:MAG: hypothetical protein LBI62_05940 [Candidatus Accumulibacter sp.]|nr:hypothetical protein [Accumulibacter sp.]